MFGFRVDLLPEFATIHLTSGQDKWGAHHCRWKQIEIRPSPSQIAPRTRPSPHTPPVPSPLATLLCKSTTPGPAPPSPSALVVRRAVSGRLRLFGAHGLGMRRADAPGARFTASSETGRAESPGIPTRNPRARRHPSVAQARHDPRDLALTDPGAQQPYD